MTENENARRFREVYSMAGMPEQRTLVLNSRCAAVRAIAERDPEDETTGLLCAQVYDLARMSAKPLEGEEITAFLNRSAKLLSMVAEK